MALYVRELMAAEQEQLQTWLTDSDAVIRHRARIVLLSSQGYRIPEIGSLLKAHPANLRKWIHRFDTRGCAGLRTLHSGGPQPRFSSRQRREIIELARSRPRELGLNFTSWTLHRLAQQAAQRRIVGKISHECIRQILKDAHCDYRGMKRVQQF